MNVKSHQLPSSCSGRLQISPILCVLLSHKRNSGSTTEQYVACPVKFTLNTEQFVKVVILIYKPRHKHLPSF